MRVISTNLITTVSASSEDANYPASLLLHNEHPKDYWQAVAGVSKAVLSLDIASMSMDRVVITPVIPAQSLAIDATSGVTFGGDSVSFGGDSVSFGGDPVPGGMMAVSGKPQVLSRTGIALFNTNAQTAFINISDPNEVIWFDTTLYDTICEIYLIPVLLDLVSMGGEQALWAEFESVPAALRIEITLTCSAGETVRCGSPVVGELAQYPCPQYGYSRSIVSYSLSRELNNGAFWHKKRDEVRSFDNLTTRMPHDGRYGAHELYRLAMGVGYGPMAWNIIDSNGFEYVVFARFGQKPIVQQITASDSQVNFSLIEVL